MNKYCLHIDLKSIPHDFGSLIDKDFAASLGIYT